MSETWKTAITDIGPNKIRVRGYDIADIMEKLSYAETVYLLLKGKLPSKAEAELMNAILVSCIDHSAAPPSVLAARTVISGGNPLNAAVAGGVLVIGDTHGGAVEQSAKILQEWAVKEGSPEEIAEKLLVWLNDNHMRMPGFGHLLHKTDPRTVKLFKMTKKLGFDGKHFKLCLAIEKAIEKKKGRRIPVNIDGAIAAVISDMGFDWRLGKGFFIISRTPGLIAHAYEELTREKPLRVLGKSFEYDGPKGGKIE